MKSGGEALEAVRMCRRDVVGGRPEGKTGWQAQQTGRLTGRMVGCGW